MLDPYSSDPWIRIRTHILGPYRYGSKRIFYLPNMNMNIENIYLFNSCDINRTDVSAIVHGILSIQDTRA